MIYSTELIDLLNIGGLIDKVWINEDATIWHTHEVQGFREVLRGDILKQKKTSKNGTK